MSVTKILDHKNLNLLHQVEMRLRHVYFHHVLPYHLDNWACVLHHFMKHLKISLALHMWRPLHTLLELLLNITYTTGTTSKHQRATWSELYRKLIVFQRIVVWHMRLSACLLHVWSYGAGCCNVIKNAAKKYF